MDDHTAREWLEGLGRAWRALDADAMAALFTEDASDQVDPFQSPVRGRENLRKGFAWWMKDQRDIRIAYGRVDVIGQRFYAEVDAEWFVASTGERVQERGLLVCEMDGNHVRTMREYWKKRKG